MKPHHHKAILLGFLGIVLLVLGMKFAIEGVWQAQPPLDLVSKPVLLFFTLEDSCDCMQELIESAEAQIQNWPSSARLGTPIQRIDFDERKDLASKYKIFRVPCLVLLNSTGEIVHRQDYPLIDGGPFNLSEFEEQIHSLLSAEGT